MQAFSFRAHGIWFMLNYKEDSDGNICKVQANDIEICMLIVSCVRPLGRSGECYHFRLFVSSSGAPLNAFLSFFLFPHWIEPLLHGWQCYVISVSRMFPNSRPSHTVTKGSRGVTSDTDRHMLEDTGSCPSAEGSDRETWRGLSVQPCWWISRHLTDKERPASKHSKGKWRRWWGKMGVGSNVVTAATRAVVVCHSFSLSFFPSQCCSKLPKHVLWKTQIILGHFLVEKKNFIKMQRYNFWTNR